MRKPTGVNSNGMAWKMQCLPALFSGAGRRVEGAQ
jgi:hypothetical protein